MSESELKSLGRLVGTWSTEATHPALPGIVVHGQAEIEWLEGQQFLIQRSRQDHPDFPSSISVIGTMEQDRVSGGASRAQSSAGPLTMHYFDERGVFRRYETAIDETAWRLVREAPGFSQRFVGTFTDNGHTVSGLWQLCRDDVQWTDDLRITYRRRN
jgi:hypothetical protein